MLTGRQPGHGFGRAAVVGAGLMGRGIAGVLAAGGLDVVLCDIQPDVLAQAVSAAAALAARAASTRPARAAEPGQVSASPDLSVAVRDADLVVEAVAESLAVKQEVFARLSVLAPSAVLATNTSVLPVTAIAERAKDPGRVLGTHWWNPPDLIPVVEVVPGRLTAEDVTGRVMALLSANRPDTALESA